MGALPGHPPKPDRLHHLLVSELTPIALFVFGELLLRYSHTDVWVALGASSAGPKKSS